MSEMMMRVARALSDADHMADGDYRKLARAAIEAMREPTEAMIASDQLPYSPGEMIGFWEIMIDAALSPSPNTEVQK